MCPILVWFTADKYPCNNGISSAWNLLTSGYKRQNQPILNSYEWLLIKGITYWEKKKKSFTFQSDLQVFRKLSEGKECCTADHLVIVRQTATHCLKHGWQHPNTHTKIKHWTGCLFMCLEIVEESLLCSDVICTALGQHSHTHETSLTLIWVLTWQTSLSERQLQDPKTQIT